MTLRARTLRARLRIAALLQAVLVAGVAIWIGGSWWLGGVAVVTFVIAWGFGTVIDQGVATMIGALVCLGFVLTAYRAPQLFHWSLPAGIAAGLGTGWVASMLLDLVFGLKIRRLGDRD